MKKLIFVLGILAVLCAWPCMSYQETPDEETGFIKVEDVQEPGTREWLQYVSYQKKGVKTEVGCHYVAKDGLVRLEVLAISTGKGADFRRWEVTDIKLVIDGQVIRPAVYDKFYVQKESIFRWPAAVVFAVFGSQYERYTVECAGCASYKVGTVANVIDKVGMAAGMGLLVSQAKGDITGLKSEFRLTQDEAKKIDGKTSIIKIKTENREANKTETVKAELSAPADLLAFE